MLREAGDSTLWYVSSGGYRNVEGLCEGVAAALDTERTREIQVERDDEVFEPMGLDAYRAP